MTFLNGLMAFGAAAFTIPLIIHLLNRSRFQTIDWGAMQFLQSSSKLNSRRMRWQQWLLLLLRCAIPALLAIAMARPLLHAFLSGVFLSNDGQSPISLAIVLDDSLSMFATDAQEAAANPKTRFTQACQSAAELCLRLPSGSNAQIVFAGTTPQLLNAPTPDLLAAKLRDAGKRSVSAGDLALQDAMSSALQWLASSPHSRRQVVVLSDFQKHEWSRASSSIVQEIASKVAGQSVPPSLTWMRVGAKSKQQENTKKNLSIDAIEVMPGQLVPESDASISITIRNHSREKSESFQVAVMVDEFEIERQPISIDAESTTQIRARWSPKKIGETLIRSQIMIPDELALDNTVSLVASVRESIPVLIVDGDIRQEAMQSEADFLRIALSPYSMLGGKKGDVFSSKTVSPDQLTESAIAGSRVLCLCNVSQLSQDQQRWVHRFVEQGNGLIVFFGDKVKTEEYRQWPTVSNGGLRIAKYSPRERTRSNAATGSSSNGTNAEGDPSSRLDVQQLEFSPLRELSSTSVKSLSGVRFEYRTPIQLETDSGNVGEVASVAMRFADGQPWILESRIEKGRCLWIGSACDDDESNLPTRSIFVPLIQKLTHYVCNSETTGPNVLCGAPWSIPLVEATNENKSQTQDVIVTKPDGTKVDVKWKSTEPFYFADTRLLGNYEATQLRPATESALETTASKQPNQRWNFSVRSNNHRDGLESNLQYLSTEELKTLAVHGNANLAMAEQDLLSQSQLDWHGREIWTWVWSLLVLCFLAEIALAQSLSPHRKPRSDYLQKPISGAAR